MKKRTYKMLLLLIIVSLLLPSSSFAYDDSEFKVKHDFYTDEFIFRYSDGNTTTYKGDSGLGGVTCVNKVNNQTYTFAKPLARGIAYATKGTFKFKEHLDVTHSVARDDNSRIILKMYYKNGTEIRSLDVTDDDLTLEQKSYFDDYYGDREAYYQKQSYLAEANAETDRSAMIRQLEKSKSTRGHGYTSGGQSFYYHSTS